MGQHLIKLLGRFFWYPIELLGVNRGSEVLGGINNALFFQSLAGYAVVALILIPLLKWAFPTNKAIKAERAQLRAMRREIRRIKKK
jgi:hypothetical protein